MASYGITHLTDVELVQNLATLINRDRAGTAVLLAHLAEFDARRLFVPAGYPSMFAYCVDELHFSENEAAKRIHAARAARRFPDLFSGLAAGRLHLTGVCLLAPHLTEQNAQELIEAATHRRKDDIQNYLIGRFPDILPRISAAVIIRPVVQAASADNTREATLFDARQSGVREATLFEASQSRDRPAAPPPSISDDTLDSNFMSVRHKEHVLEHAESVSGHSPQPAVPIPAQPSSPTHNQSPLAQTFLVRLTIAGRTHDKLREAQALLSHVVPPDDVAEVLDRALDALIVQLKKRKIGAKPGRALTAHTGEPAQGADPANARQPRSARYITKTIRRAVWERDGGQCTFVGTQGHRCAERRFLEFDHIEPIARGGTATIEGLRLRCRAHNQHEAERVFGAAFMRRKRHEAQRARSKKHRPTSRE